MEPQFPLTQWQKKQAYLLYHFSSLPYLMGLKERVDNLKSYAEERIHQSRSQGRDRFLHSAQWGDRNTTENWSTNAWQFLADFQLSVVKAIADLPSQIYHITGTYQCARGISEYSMQWATADEEMKFDEMLAEISRYSRKIDRTMQKHYQISWWDDFGLALAWEEHAQMLHQIPKFRVLPDIISGTDNIPPRTGVYIAMDDPQASLQFAWNGAPGGELLPGSTLNDLGRAALSAVGRQKLWVDQAAMYEFICKNLSHPALADDPYLDEPPEPPIAASLIARHAFTGCSTRWCFVEMVEGEFESIEREPDLYKSSSTLGTQRFTAGETCIISGYYITPARLDSRRRFVSGDVFPHLDSAYGKTIWQWDTQQD